MTCSQCNQPTLSDGVCVDCSNKRFDDYPRLNNIVDRLKEYVSFECNPSYEWSARKVYDDLNRVLDPNYKPSKALELDDITPRREERV